MKKAQRPEREPIATNRKARHYFEILETVEAGLVLLGPEVKSLRAGKASLEGSFARPDGPRLALHNLHIAPYAFATHDAPDPRRARGLLLRRPELQRLLGRLQTRGLTLVPLELYFKRGWAKVELGLARAKKGPDRREDLKRRAVERDAEKSFKGRFRA